MLLCWSSIPLFIACSRIYWLSLELCKLFATKIAQFPFPIKLKSEVFFLNLSSFYCWVKMSITGRELHLNVFEEKWWWWKINNNNVKMNERRTDCSFFHNDMNSPLLLKFSLLCVEWMFFQGTACWHCLWQLCAIDTKWVNFCETFGNLFDAKLTIHSNWWVKIRYLIIGLLHPRNC